MSGDMLSGVGTGKIALTSIEPASITPAEAAAPTMTAAAEVAATPADVA